MVFLVAVHSLYHLFWVDCRRGLDSVRRLDFGDNSMRRIENHSDWNMALDLQSILDCYGETQETAMRRTWEVVVLQEHDRPDRARA